VEGYHSDKDFASLVNRTREELPDKGKNCAYRLGTNGMLYFEDTDGNLWLCVPKSERLDEIHDSAHESTHAGWECTLANLREQFYWPSMQADVTKYVLTCDPCQKIKHDRGGKKGFLQPLSIPATPFDTITLEFVTGLPDP
jgi:hypothetical protein